MTRLLPPVDERIETGPIQFGDDWPGVFFRGDNALTMAFCLDMYIKGARDVMTVMAVEGLVKELNSCRDGG